MEKIISNFDEFKKKNYFDDNTKLKEQNDNSNIDAPPGNDWIYVNVKGKDEPKSDEEDWLDEVKRDILKTALYGQIAGAFLVDIKQRYGDKLAFSHLDNIYLYLEEFAFNNPNPKKMTKAFAEIEKKIKEDYNIK